MSRRKRVKRLLRGGRSKSAFSSRLETSAPMAPEQRRVAPAPPVYILPPGESRYQRRSAKLPRGVERFTGLAVDPEIMVDLTESETEEATVDGGA